jgi:hypothetical protein
VVLELEPDDPVQGTIVGPDDEREAFYGWLELAAALGRLRPLRATADERDQTALRGEVSQTPQAGQL